MKNTFTKEKVNWGNASWFVVDYLLHCGLITPMKLKWGCIRMQCHENKPYSWNANVFCFICVLWTNIQTTTVWYTCHPRTRTAIGEQLIKCNNYSISYAKS